MLFKLRMGSRAKHLNLRQRLTGFAFDLRQLVQIPIALSYIIIPFVLLSGSPLVFWGNGDQLKMLIRLVSIWSACHWLHNGVMGAIAGTGNDFTAYDVRMASYDSEMEQWLSPCKPLSSLSHQDIADPFRLLRRFHALFRPAKSSRRSSYRLQSFWQYLERSPRAFGK